MEDFEKYYRSYKYMQKLLKTDFTHNYLNQNLEDSDKGDDVLTGKINEKVIDMDWVTAIEEALPYIEKAIDEQRRFIKETQEVYRIDKARTINKDSVKHLSQHTNFIAKVEGDKVTPNKVLTVEREESFEIYENRFLVTLIKLATQFVNDKYTHMVNAPTDTYNKMEMKRDLVLNKQKVTFNIEYSNEIKDDRAADLDVQDYENLSDFDRVRRIREKLNSFLHNPMMKEIYNCTPVRPPILHTNLMMKNPNFKASLDLYNYLSAYKKPGFEIIGKEYSGKMDKEVQEGLYFSLGFQHFMMSISTNTALKNLLEEKYQEENEQLEKEHKLPTEEIQRRELERIDEVRQEEMKIRLQEIRERENIIRKQKAEIAALKREIESRDRTIEKLNSDIKALQEQLKEVTDELNKTKLELVRALEKIEQLEAKVAELEAKVAELEQIKAQLEAQIAQLEKQVAQLEAKVQELEAKITELEGIIEEQKAKIAELENTVAEQKIKIAELEKFVAELEKIKAELEQRVDFLEDENAKQKELIASHEETIAQQKQAIAELEQSITQAKSEIDSLNDMLAQRDKHIEDQAYKIESLNKNVADLNSNLEAERKAHEQDVENEKKSHADHVAKLNTMFEDEKAQLEAEHQKQIDNNNKEFDKKLEKLNSDHSSEIQKLNKRAENEKAQIQKTADQRVKSAQKEAEKSANAKAKQEIAKAQKSAKDSAKKAREDALKLKKGFKAEKGVKGLYKFDCTFGALGMQTLKALDLVSKGIEQQVILGELMRTSRLSCVYVVKDDKKITISEGSLNDMSVVKTIKGGDSLDVCKEYLNPYLANADKAGAYVTYKSVDKLYLGTFEQYLVGELGFENVETFHNKQQKSGVSTLGFYYYKG